VAKLTPKQAQEKHARNLKASVPDITIGVDAVTEAPGKKAAAAQAKMKANLVASIDDGTWAKRVSAVTLEDWKKQMKDKGIGRISAGIDGAAAKTEDFFSQLFAYQDSIKPSLDAMPDLTLEDSISRMTKWVRDMAKFSKK